MRFCHFETLERKMCENQSFCTLLNSAHSLDGYFVIVLRILKHFKHQSNYFVKRSLGICAKKFDERLSSTSFQFKRFRNVLACFRAQNWHFWKGNSNFEDFTS